MWVLMKAPALANTTLCASASRALTHAMTCESVFPASPLAPTRSAVKVFECSPPSNCIAAHDSETSGAALRNQSSASSSSALGQFFSKSYSTTRSLSLLPPRPWYKSQFARMRASTLVLVAASSSSSMVLGVIRVVRGNVVAPNNKSTPPFADPSIADVADADGADDA